MVDEGKGRDRESPELTWVTVSRQGRGSGGQAGAKDLPWPLGNWWAVRSLLL